MTLRTDAAGDRGREPVPPDPSLEFHALLTIDEVAALLKVSRSWVYEHTRSNRAHRGARLPHLKLGKYVRFELRAVHRFLAQQATKTFIP